MKSYQSCAADPARKGACVPTLELVRQACNAAADDAQARMQELGSVTSKKGKKELDAYTTALNMLYGVSREAQQLSYKDPAGLELLKTVNRDTGVQQYNMNRTFEVVEKKEAEAKALAQAAAASPAKPPPAVAPAKKPVVSARGAPTSSDKSGGGAASASAEKENPDEDAAAERAREGGAKAASRARSLGAALKNGMQDGAGLDAAGSGSGRPGTGGTAGPRTGQDLLLASVSGFGGSLTALGLKTGKDASGAPTITRADGSPATAEDLAALKARIASEPEALMRRPNFFSAIPRERFLELKTDYRGRPELRDGPFLHVGLSASERDFERSASCSKLSGPCAPHAKTASYKKGEPVPPEELAAIHRAIHDEPEEDFIDLGPDSGPDSGKPATAAASAGDFVPEPAPASPRGLKAVLAGIERLIGREPAPVSSAAAGASGARRPAGAAVPEAGELGGLVARTGWVLPAAGAALLALALLLRSRAS